MRVASWNLWWRFGDDWIGRQGAILETLIDLKPDVIGLQEVWGTRTRTQADVIAKELGLHAAFGEPSLPPVPDPIEHPDQKDVTLGVAVVSRWPIIGVKKVVLPSWGRPPSVALVATIAHPRDRLHVVVATTDWESSQAETRREQSRMLKKVMIDPLFDGSLPVLMTADLNAPPHAPEVTSLGPELLDTWTLGGGSPEGVTLSSLNPHAPKDAWQLDARIDYVFARPGSPGGQIVVERAFTVGGSVGAIFPSDHFATVSDIDL